MMETTQKKIFSGPTSICIVSIILTLVGNDSKTYIIWKVQQKREESNELLWMHPLETPTQNDKNDHKEDTFRHYQ